VARLPLFDDVERAALALTEAGTRLADESEPVSEDLLGEWTAEVVA